MEMNASSNNYFRTVSTIGLQLMILIVLYIFFFTSANHAGGEVGMAPLSLILGLSIQVLIFHIYYFSVGRRYSILTNVLINAVFFEFAHLVFSGEIPVLNVFREGLIGWLSRIESGSSLIATFIVCVIVILNQRVIPQRK